MFPSTASNLTIEQVDYQWVEQQTSVKSLKRGLKLLEDDGNHYPELGKAIKDRIKILDKNYVDPDLIHAPIDPNEKLKAQDDLYKYLNTVDRESINQIDFDDMSNANVKQKTGSSNEMTETQKVKLAEDMKIKGNECLRSNDFQEAIQYYNQSLEYKKTPIVYVNRATTYFKMKEYQKAVKDATDAIILDQSYLKAYYRRGMAYKALGSHFLSALDFKHILSKDPNEKETEKEYNGVKLKLSPQELDQLLGENQKTQYKTIQIEEEDDDEDEAASIKSYEECHKEIKNAKAFQSHGNYEEALKRFDYALNHLAKVSDPKINVAHERCDILYEMALCHYHKDDPKKVVNLTSEILQIKDIKNEVRIQSLLRRGLAYEKLEKNSLAYMDFEQVKSIDPYNKQSSAGMHRNREFMKKSENVANEKNKDVKPEIVQEEKKKIDKNTQPTQKMEETSSQKIMGQTLKSEESAQTQPKIQVSGSMNNSTIKKLSEKEIQQLVLNCENNKKEGNILFGKKKFDLAITEFSVGVGSIEKALGENGIQHAEKKLQDVYCYLLSNRSMAYLQIEKYSLCIDDCSKVLAIQPDFQKAYYRRAKGRKGLASELEKKISLDLKNSKSIFELTTHQKELGIQAIIDLNHLLKVDPSNTESINEKKELEVMVMKFEDRLSKLVEKMKSEAGKSQERTENQSSESRKEKTLLNKIEDDTKKIAEQAMESLIIKEEVPQTTSQFEIELASFKNSSQNLCRYLKKIPPELLKKLYTKSQITPEILMKLVSAYKLNSDEKVEWIFDQLEVIFATEKISLSVKMLTKKEKIELKELCELVGHKVIEKKEKIRELLDKFKLVQADHFFAAQKVLHLKMAA